MSYNNRSKYTNTPLRPASLSGIYADLYKKYFPKLLEGEKPDVASEDRIKIRAPLKKPWNPYIQRHTGLNEKASIMKEFNFRLHAGWVKTSDMIEVYTHDLGTESSEELLLAYGIQTENKEEFKQKWKLMNFYIIWLV